MKIIKRKINMGDRVIEISGNAEIAPTPRITALFTQVTTTTATLKDWLSDYTAGRGAFRAGALECRRVAGELRESMRDINEIARVLKPAEAPGAKEVFRMPRSRSYQGLLAAARHFAAAAQPLEAVFTARALPATFIADLSAKITAFEAMVGMKSGGRSGHVGASSGMKESARLLMESVQELRAIMRVHLKAKPALLAAFRSAARLERALPPENVTPAPAVGGGGSTSGTAS